MPVDSQHSEYRDNIKEWKKNRACVVGSKAIKKARTDFLPMPNSKDVSEQNKQRYEDYLTRANYVNFTGSTEEGMIGMVFRKDIELDLTTQLDYLVENVDGSGLTIDQMTRALIGDLLQTGRHGLLIDYPDAESGLSVAQVASQNLQANVLSYTAEDIINWRTEMFGGVRKLTMVVLKESKSEAQPDGFDVEDKNYHRVLLLKDKVYTQNLYDENGALVVMENGETDIIPKNSGGGTWDQIPFVFIGAKNNDSGVDKAPLSDLADVNIAHYRNSADYEDSCYLVGQPTPWVSGISQSWAKEVLKDDIKVGSREFLLLPQGGSAGLMQAVPNIMPREGMQDKEIQMVKIGARLITDNTGNETAEAAKIRFAGQNSKLGVIIGNVEAALIQAIEFAGLFMGSTGENKLVINRLLYEATIDPQLIIAQIQAMDRGVIAKKDVRDNLRKASMIDEGRTDADLDNEAETVDLNGVVV